MEAGADGALLLLRGRGDRLLLGRRDEALVAVGARDEDLAAVGVGAVAFDASVEVLSDAESLREIGGELGLAAVGALTWSRGKRCGYVTGLPPSCGVIWMVGWAVEASDLMGLP